MKTKAKCQEVAMPASEKEDDTDEESIFVKVRMTINKKVRTTNKIQMITIFDSLKHMCTTFHFIIHINISLNNWLATQGENT